MTSRNTENTKNQLLYIIICKEYELNDNHKFSCVDYSKQHFFNEYRNIDIILEDFY